VRGAPATSLETTPAAPSVSRLARSHLNLRTGAAYASLVIVVNRFRVPHTQQQQFRDDLQAARATLAARPGHLHSRIGRNADDPELWVLTTEWESVGAYRRSLSAYDVKLTAVPVLSRAIDEPSAYEVVEPGTDLNISRMRSTDPRSLG
jgi:quinol monooxygenase YgiN